MCSDVSAEVVCRAVGLVTARKMAFERLLATVGELMPLEVVLTRKPLVTAREAAREWPL